MGSGIGGDGGSGDGTKNGTKVNILTGTRIVLRWRYLKKFLRVDGLVAMYLYE